ncbi:hypothetical protein [Pontibacter burrus]|uniref:Uncharacterized protein n=1 Tax=Pontibacter burrus TaxID=2704466 RepID=A0A6B3LVP6_9BACT|nr:hypothetical protein [Pontibacter burrus]NEM97660.1 hypothetical protein [Pontibacter burrus]
MMKKQNIGTSLLLLLWATMFCFSVFTAFQKTNAPQHNSFASASAHNEKLTPEEKSDPVAWVAPSETSTSSGAEESDLPFYNALRWLPHSQATILSHKPLKTIQAFASGSTRFLIFPNAP